MYLAIKKIIVLAPSLKEWRVHAILLENNIDTEKILFHDFNDKSLIISSGICGMLMFISYFEGVETQINLDELKRLAYNKITQSSYWGDKEFLNNKRPTGLLYGISGIALCLLTLNQRIKK